MSRRIVLGCALFALLVPVAATAQEEEEEPLQAYVYGTYFECVVTKEWLADAIVEQAFKPVYDKAVDDGAISSWGYLGHHTGGKWRRVIYHIAPTLDAVLEALETINEGIEKVSAQASDTFGEICGAHEDYIWRFVTGSAGGDRAEERGEVGFSTYFICDEAKESRADEIVKETFAPIYDAQVASGQIVSWGWLQHWVGGKYRRLATTTAKDYKTLMAARDAMVEEIVKNEAASEEFSEICSSHTDYMWDIKVETP